MHQKSSAQSGLFVFRTEREVEAWAAWATRANRFYVLKKSSRNSLFSSHNSMIGFKTFTCHRTGRC
jgi:hypothetical protein